MTVKDGYYYLHTSGALIWTRSRPKRKSSFVVKSWAVDSVSRANAWMTCIEAKALGATVASVRRLAARWGLTDDDGQTFAKESSNTFGLFRDGDRWCATFNDFVDMQVSQCGFGDTVLEAFAALAKGGLLEKQAAEVLQC